jgi:hypothetical protein
MPRVQTLIEAKDGSILGVDRRRVYEKPFSLLTNPPNNRVAMAANQPSALITMDVNGDGPKEVSQLSADYDGACLCSLIMQDGNSSRALMNRKTHVANMFGSAGRPYKLPETLIIDELRQLIAEFTDISGSANSIAPALHTAHYLQIQNDPRLSMIRQRMESRQYLSLPYFYNLDSGYAVLTALQSAAFQMSIGTDHHFAIHTITATSTGAFRINIVDVARSESIIYGQAGVDYPVNSALICGDAQYPFKFHEPRLIFSGQKLNITLEDLSNQANTIYLTLGGQAVATKMWR